VPCAVHHCGLSAFRNPKSEIAIRCSQQVVANFIWITAISVTRRNVHIPAGSVAHNLTRAVDQ
jgi:hypothetical protein